MQTGYVHVKKPRDPNGGHRLRSVLYDGMLEVTDETLFHETLAHGVGPDKAYGFGLLSIAPA
jgi:CRISPR system Cascade subunit CasE